MPYLELDGNKIYYAGDAGKEGVPVLFCHGSGGGHHHWLFQLKRLPETISPIAVDLPGHGRSEGAPTDKVSLYRDWLHRFKEALGLGPIVLAGHSLGGAIALDYALCYADHLSGLILVGTGGRLRVLPSFLETLKTGNVPVELTEYLYGPEVPDDLYERGRQEVKSTEAAVYLADLSACDKFDVMEELHRINHPALILCGSNDQLTPVKYSRYLEENLPRGRFELIEGAGHMVMIEKPHAVNEAVARFVEQNIAAR